MADLLNTVKSLQFSQRHIVSLKLHDLQFQEIIIIIIIMF